MAFINKSTQSGVVLCLSSEKKSNCEVSKRALNGNLREQPKIPRRHYWFPRETTSEKRAQTITRHFRDLDSVSDWSSRVGNLRQPIRSTTQFWVVTYHQYGISAFVSQTSFRGETSAGAAK